MTAGPNNETISKAERPTPDTMREWLKVETQNIHSQAENTEFIKRMMEGRITREMYQIFLANLYFVYKSLEEELERNKHLQTLQAVWLPTEMSRLRALEEDLAFYFGPNWRELIRCTETGLAYATRICVLGKCDPDMLLAHTYSRYLGDLSGGQIIKRKIQKALSLRTNDGVRFYCFEEITDVKKFKEFYTSRMNAIDTDLTTKHRMKDEALISFQLNIDLFKEMDRIAIVIGGYHERKQRPVVAKEVETKLTGVRSLIGSPYLGRVAQIAVVGVAVSALPFLYKTLVH